MKTQNVYICVRVEIAVLKKVVSSLQSLISAYPESPSAIVALGFDGDRASLYTEMQVCRSNDDESAIQCLRLAHRIHSTFATLGVHYSAAPSQQERDTMLGFKEGSAREQLVANNTTSNREFAINA